MPSYVLMILLATLPALAVAATALMLWRRLAGTRKQLAVMEARVQSEALARHSAEQAEVAAQVRAMGQKKKLLALEEENQALECRVEEMADQMSHQEAESERDRARLEAELKAEISRQETETKEEAARQEAQLKEEIARQEAQLKEEIARQGAEITAAVEDLKQTSQLLSQHLKTPIRRIGSLLQLLDERYGGKLGSETDELITYAMDGARQIDRLIDNLVALTSVACNGRDLQHTDAHAIFEAALSSLEVEIEECSANVEAGELPVLMAKPSELRQLFVNLIDNALKFRSNQAPDVQVSARRLGDEFEFAVRDNGIGMEPTGPDRIFMMSQRLHPHDFPGTGIGLALCRRIVERHGGRIWVESQVGRGSTFRFTIPERVVAGSSEASYPELARREAV